VDHLRRWLLSLLLLSICCRRAAQQRQCRALRKALAAAAQRWSAVVTSQGSGSTAWLQKALAAAAQPRSAVFSSQVSGSAGRWQLQPSGGIVWRWQLQRSVGVQWCLCRSAACCCSVGWQRQRGIGSGSVAAAAQRRIAVLSSQGSADQISSAVRWQWQCNGSAVAAVQRRQRRALQRSGGSEGIVSCSVVE